MSLYAVIQDGVIIDKIVADSIEIAETLTGLECIESDLHIGPHIGWIFDGSIWRIENPPFEDENLTWVWNAETGAFETGPDDQTIPPNRP
jgi:hypothetical protein